MDYFDKQSLAPDETIAEELPLEPIIKPVVDPPKTTHDVNLNKKSSRPPQASSRFLHGGQALSTLTAPSIVISSISKKPTALSSSSWRAFTDEEEAKLQSAWNLLGKEDVSDSQVESKEGEEKISKPDDELQPHIVPVGLDKLFSVNLNTLVLSPDFWQGTEVRVIKSLWFYAPPSSSSDKPSHLLKAYPVDRALEEALELAYHEICPWEESYAEELKSALKVGRADVKLRKTLLGGEGGVEVIFQDATVGRVYSTGILGSVGKSFFSSSNAFGGGQIVLRGWEAVRSWKKVKSFIDKDGAITADSEGEEVSTPPRSGNTSATASTSKLPSTASPSLFDTIRSKLGAASLNESKSEGRKGEVNETEQAMDGLRNRDNAALEDEDGNIKEPDELVLVIHGIGQKLVSSFEALNFLYMVNQLRNNCTNLSTSSLAPLIHNKRAQFIPVRWKVEMDYDDDEDEEEEDTEEHLNNKFELADVKLDSVPFLRQVVEDLVLDVPLYLSHHKHKMIGAVVKDANRIYRLFCSRNPSFAANGKVSIIAHSLGSALTADILSTQETFVKPFSEMSSIEKNSETQFIFDTRNVFLVGSPLAFFLHLGKGQLIARGGRERTASVGKDIALDRPRFGCLAADAIYNIYNSTDPVAFSLNPTVDVEYAKLISPIAIPSTNDTLLENFTKLQTKVSKLFEFDVANIWGASSESKEKAKEEMVDKLLEKSGKKDGPPVVKRPTVSLKRMPSERPNMDQAEFIKISRAEKRFNALNPQGSVDFYLPAEGLISNQYLDAITSHNNYWSDLRFSQFILTQLFASTAVLEKTGREEIASEE